MYTNSLSTFLHFYCECNLFANEEIQRKLNNKFNKETKHQTCHITRTLHLYELSFMSGSGWDDGGATGEEAAKNKT